MSMMDCWPDWLKRRSDEVFGPGIQPFVAYPVFQLQPPIIDANNPNQSTNPVNAFFQSTAGLIATANVGTRILHVMPATVYDCFYITVFDDHNSVSNNDALNFPVPIFVSFDRPGRIVSEVSANGNNKEVMLATANAYSSADPTNTPNQIYLPNPYSGTAKVNYYNSVVIEGPRTNRPFYIWFNDGIAQAPTGNCVYKVSWFTRGR